MTLRDQITADVPAVFLSTSEFAEDIIHYPAGDLSAGVTVQAVIDRDNEDGVGLGEGEGPRFDRPHGVKLRRSALLELAVSVTVTEASGTQRVQPSLFEFDGHRWRTVRVSPGRDDAMQTVLVNRIDKLADRRVERP